MKKMIVTLLTIVIMLGGVPFTVFGQEETEISQYLDNTLSAMVNKKQVKGVVVSVVRGTDIELCKGYGFADEKRGRAAHGKNTAFRIGSISKTFVAVAVQQLVEKGKMDMDAPVSDYLDADFPKFKYEVTMHQLLTHTAGFEDMLSGIAIYDIKKSEPLALSIRKYIPAQVFAPGEVVSYSNYGIALAAYVVECITGQDFYQYAEEYIFEPLGMTKTSFELGFEGVAVSKAYATNGKETIEPLINLYPEGSMVSTAADMATYMRWLMDGSNKVLTAKGKSQIFAQHFTMSGEFPGLGYTWNRKERNGVTYYDKKGETVNFYSRITLYPKQQVGVFLSFNTYVDEEELNGIMDEITNLLLGPGKQQRLYTGEQTADISGYYITTRASFENLEKVINFVTPNCIIHISGSLSSGFKMNGKKLSPIGQNYYNTPMGNLKFVETNGSAYLANNTAISYVRTNWYESNGVQMFIVLFFAVTSLLMAGISLIGLFRRKTDKCNYFLAGLSLLNFAFFLAMCILILAGIINFMLLSMVLPIRMCGILILLASVGGVLYTVYLLIKNRLTLNSSLLVVWNLSSILFILWMIEVNIM